MPRLTHSDYYLRHTLLSLLWDEVILAYGQLSYAEQQALHWFFLPTCELDLTELTAYRSYVTKLEPSLPQRAGRAYVRLSQALVTGRPLPASNQVVVHNRTIKLHAIARPDINVAKLARTYVELARTPLLNGPFSAHACNQFDGEYKYRD